MRLLDTIRSNWGPFLTLFITLSAVGFLVFLHHYESYYYTSPPVISDSQSKSNVSQEFIIINEKFQITCFISRYVPYEQKADTSFFVRDKAGEFVRAGRQSFLKNYFREYFKW